MPSDGRCESSMKAAAETSMDHREARCHQATSARLLWCKYSVSDMFGFNYAIKSLTDCFCVLLALCGTYRVSPDTVNIVLCQICFKPRQRSGARGLFWTACLETIKPDPAWRPFRQSKHTFAKRTGWKAASWWLALANESGMVVATVLLLKEIELNDEVTTVSSRLLFLKAWRLQDLSAPGFNSSWF